jgi:hypothetical protein
MKITPRRLLAGAWALLVFTSACNMPAAPTATPLGTILPAEQVLSTPAPTGIWSGLPATSVSIPVTGMDPVTLQCQFCVNDVPHAVLIVGENASFNVAEPLTRVTCLTAQVVNGRRIVLCRGAAQTAFNLNVCTGGTNCSLFPVTLETCPILSQTGAGTARPTLAAPTATVPIGTATGTRIPRVTPVRTAIPTSTTVILPPAGTSTSAAPLQPTVAPVLPTQAAATSLADPAGFIRWYFNAVWAQRTYQELWNNYLTPSFRTNVGSGSFEDYEIWWNSVERVDLHSVEVMQNDGSHAWVRVNVTFTMRDGRIVANQQYDYDLLFDAARQTWMFDYRV